VTDALEDGATAEGPVLAAMVAGSTGVVERRSAQPRSAGVTGRRSVDS
jgi:hypothetical protein